MEIIQILETMIQVQIIQYVMMALIILGIMRLITYLIMRK